jgi:aryl-alcohol dehydrogenase-like predicted oxidoreductase
LKLKALQTDYIDVYLAHSVDREILERNEVAEAFCKLKTKGYVRSIGVSTYGYDDTKFAIDDGRWNVIQLAFNLMDQSATQLFPLAKQQGIGIMVRSVLMRGILTDNAPLLTHEKLRRVNEHRHKFLDFCKQNAFARTNDLLRVEQNMPLYTPSKQQF